VVRNPGSTTMENFLKEGTRLLQQVHTYYLSDAADPPDKQFILMGNPKRGGALFKMNRPAGLDYWKLLHRVINSETVEERDRIILGSLAAIGIEHGSSFTPDERMSRILTHAETIGKAILANESFSPRHDSRGHKKELYPGTYWERSPVMPCLSQEGPNHTYLANRMAAYYQIHLAQLLFKIEQPSGLKQSRAACYKDSSGYWLKGEYTYCLQVLPNVPVKNSWSITFMI
jgi:hypothetical protein